MRKEISEEMYNYNKFPGPQFMLVGDRVQSDSYEFSLMDNEKSAFDATAFTQRFSEVLLKYDYIVGDWGNEQLRLRGFYKKTPKGKENKNITRLEDYLNEYCNFGCAYFVLENPEPEEIFFEEELVTKRKKKSNKKERQNYPFKDKKRKDSVRRDNNRRRRQEERAIKDARAQFVIRKKERKITEEEGSKKLLESDMKPSIYSLTRDELIEWAIAHGEKKFRATQIWDWLYRKRVQSFEEMTNISKDFIALLNENFCVNPLKQRIVQESADGTVKYLFELPDGMLIETVLMRQHYGLSVCVTTQVGCNIGCTFCASGLIKKQRDLNNGEITAQIMLVQKYFDERGQDERVSHVVVMGIGEPFDNYDNVMKFLRTINDDNGLAIGARHITVSTSGLAHKIRDFANEGVQVNLAVSLHAPNNDLRSSIMRINRSFPLEKLFDAIEYYIEKTNRRVTFEYIMLNEVNDGVEQAQELADLTKNIRKLSYVNLIPYNPVSEHDQYSRSPKERVAAFYDVLKKNGVNCVVRQEHGTDIDAACGQLRSNTMKRDRQKAAAALGAKK